MLNIDGKVDRCLTPWKRSFARRPGRHDSVPAALGPGSSVHVRRRPRASSNWRTRLVRAGWDSANTSAARVTIRDSKGKTVLDIEPDGPLLLLDLVPGNYTVEAAYREQVQTRKVAIEANKHKQLVFVWKEQEAD